MHQTRRLLPVLAILLLVSACSTPLKERITLGLQATNTVVNSAQTAEISAFESGVAPWTEADRRTFHAALTSYYDSAYRVTELLLAWRSGDPPPQGLRDTLLTMHESLSEAIRVLPADNVFSATLSHLRTGVESLQLYINLVQEGL